MRSRLIRSGDISENNLTAQPWSLEQFRDYWRNEYFGVKNLVEDELFSLDLSLNSQKKLFKKHVTAVWIEFSSYCNRKCTFCPNTDGSRLSQRNLLDVEVFRKILDELAEIQYDGRIALHEYNEPLAEPTFFERLEDVNNKLPEAYAFLTTNGDYLTRKKLTELSRLGLKHINISIYGPNHGVFNDDYILQRMQDLESSLNIDGDFVQKKKNVSYVYNGQALGMSITMRGNNLQDLGFDRGGLITNLTPTERRRSPCYAPFKEFHVTWQGLVKPCCNIYPEKVIHKNLTTGNLADRKTIFEHYCSSSMVWWRKSLNKLNPEPSPCVGCSWPWINV